MSNWTFAVRRVRNKPNFFKADRVSSALFKDAKGVSANRDDDRLLTEIIQDEETLHNYYKELSQNDSTEHKLKAIVSVDRAVINEKGILIEKDPLKENVHHIVLKKDEETNLLTDSQAKALARNSKFIKKYED